MNRKQYLSASEYAEENHISKMQVIRLIRQGKLFAQRVGNVWMIPQDSNNLNQIGLEKYTSIQKWGKLIENELHKKIHVEESKDRELIYSRLHSLGLPHEKCFAFQIGKFPSRIEFQEILNKLGLPYWISAVPDSVSKDLNRQTKLRLYDIETGWDFINKIPEKEKYKIIIAQYADQPEFKGTVIISQKGFGIAEFVTGDRHYIMTRGFTLTDPMLFSKNKIERYSKTISHHFQDRLYAILASNYGHLEFQYGTIEGKRSITFLDYNDEIGYLEIDKIWKDLLKSFTSSKKGKNKLFGLPASPGKAKGRCFVFHHEMVGFSEKMQEGDILVSDTTTPEMTSMIGKASAIVTDLGGVLSHAAIICRELNLPAIVGVVNATEKLRTGNQIIVDADKGEIEIVA